MVELPGGPDDDAKLPTIQDVIENIGFGFAQLRVLFLGGCIWLADGSELLLISTVSRTVAEEWHMRAWQRGAVVSVVFVGIWLGNLLSGPAGDAVGRRFPILLSYVGIFVFSVLSAYSQNFYQLGVLRLAVGASFGIGQPATVALCTEVTPTRWRVMMGSFASSFFTVGELYSAALVWWDDPYMRDVNWRWLLAAGAAPAALLAVLAMFFLHESPMFLSANGEHTRARAILENMRDENGASHVSCDFKMAASRSRPGSPVEALTEPIAFVFGRRMFFSTVTVLYSCFTLNFTYYGALYALPQVLTGVDLGPSPAVALMLGALMELPGTALGAAVGSYMKRKPAMALYCATTALALLAFVLGTSSQVQGLISPMAASALRQGGYFGLKCFPSIGFIVVYQYATEIYPTASRTTGTATCLAGGRVGGIVAPLLFEWQAELLGGFQAFFYTTAALCAVNGFLVLALPFETFDKSVEEDGIDEAWPIARAH